MMPFMLPEPETWVKLTAFSHTVMTHRVTQWPDPVEPAFCRALNPVLSIFLATVLVRHLLPFSAVLKLAISSLIHSLDDHSSDFSKMQTNRAPCTCCSKIFQWLFHCLLPLKLKFLNMPCTFLFSLCSSGCSQFWPVLFSLLSGL